MSTKLIPILFSTPMVQAILQGQKTMTRRTKGLEKINENPNDWVLTPTKKKICRLYSGVNPNPIKTFFIFENIHTKEQIEIASPYGETRDEASMCDVIWVRESFNISLNPNEYCYKADTDNPIYLDKNWKWKPSIHMPFFACRIFLRITDIRIERLNDISEQDAKAEGISKCTLIGCEDLWESHTQFMGFESAIDSFLSLWEKINGKESVSANPWVWVISFERCVNSKS